MEGDTFLTFLGGPHHGRRIERPPAGFGPYYLHAPLRWSPFEPEPDPLAMPEVLTYYPEKLHIPCRRFGWEEVDTGMEYLHMPPALRPRWSRFRGLFLREYRDGPVQSQLDRVNGAMARLGGWEIWDRQLAPWSMLNEATIELRDLEEMLCIR